MRFLSERRTWGSLRIYSQRMDVKKSAIIFNLMNLLLFATVVQAELKIDFSQMGGRVEAGYEGYFAAHENPATFTAQSYSAFGTTVTVTPSWAAGATQRQRQARDARPRAFRAASGGGKGAVGRRALACFSSASRCPCGAERFRSAAFPTPLFERAEHAGPE